MVLRFIYSGLGRVVLEPFLNFRLTKLWAWSTELVLCCAGDETLRFWNVFPGAKSQGTSVTDSTVGSMMRTHIR